MYSGRSVRWLSSHGWRAPVLLKAAVLVALAIFVVTEPYYLGGAFGIGAAIATYATPILLVDFVAWRWRVRRRRRAAVSRLSA